MVVTELNLPLPGAPRGPNRTKTLRRPSIGERREAGETNDHLRLDTAAKC